MSYYMSKVLSGVSFDDAVEKVTAALAEEGFGVLTQIDVKATMKKKLDKDFKPYLILGACNPSMAFQALSLEDKIGTMLPCNVVVTEADGGDIEVAAVDPMASMMAVKNAGLGEVAADVRGRLQKVVEAL